MNKLIPLFLASLLLLLGCGGETLQSVELHGYIGEKMTMKWLYKLESHKLEDGASGFREEHQYLYRENAQKQGNSVKTVFLNPDYSLSHSQKTLTSEGRVAQIDLRIEGKEVVYTTTVGEEKKEKRAPVAEPVYTEIPPILFAKELTEVGSTKGYRVFSEKSLSFKTQVIKLVARREIKVSGKTRACLQYQQVGVGNWFLDEKSKELVRIEMDNIIFVKP